MAGNTISVPTIGMLLGCVLATIDWSPPRRPPQRLKKATVEVEWLGASRIMGKSTPVDTLFHPEKSKEDKKTGPKKRPASRMSSGIQKKPASLKDFFG